MLQLYVWKAVILDLVPNLFFSLLAGAQTHAVLVIGMYELLGNPTT
jgi:hypothetical protein